MGPKYFEDYVKELRLRGEVPLPPAVLVRVGGAELDVSRIRTTMVLPPVSFGAARDGLPKDLSSLGAVYPVAKRAGNAFEHIGVGRTANVDIPLPIAQISKYHAYFQVDAEGNYTLADAGSKNGTSLNGRKLAVRTPARVRDGEVVSFGPHAFLFHTRTGFEKLLHARA